METKFLTPVVFAVSLIFQMTLFSIGSAYYIVTTPKIVRPGVPFTVVFSYPEFQRATKLNASIISTESDQVIDENSVQDVIGGSTSFQLQLPMDSKSGDYRLKVEGYFSNGYSFVNESQLVYKSDGMIVLIQTDKAIYKPGQTVYFRTMAVYPDLKPFTGSFDVEIMDPDDNVIKQWTGLQDDYYGVINESLPTSTQPVLGDWVIKVNANGITKTKTFAIDEYKLPKFEVSITSPTYILQNEGIGIKVTAMYTYGKPVVGKCIVTMTHQNTKNSVSSMILDMDEEAGFTFIADQLNYVIGYEPDEENPYSYFPENTMLTLTANVTDSLSGVSLTGTSYVKLHKHHVKLQFLDSTPNTFKPGLIFPIFISASRQDDTPLINTDKHSSTLRYRFSYEEEYQERIITFPENGISYTYLNTSKDILRIDLSIKDYYEDDFTDDISHYANPAESPTNSYVEIALLNEDLTAGDTATFNLYKTQQFSASDPDNLYRLQIVSRGNIVHSQMIGLNVEVVNVVTTNEMAPIATVLVFYLTDEGEVVVTSMSFNIKEGFNNQVSVEFSEAERQPGEEVRVDVKADPQSFVGLLAVDQSVLLLKSGNDITQDEVMSEISGMFGNQQYPSTDQPFWFRRRKRSIHCFWCPQYGAGETAAEVFDSANINVLTDGYVHQKEISDWPIFLEMDGYDYMELAPAVAEDGMYYDAALPLDNEIGGTNEEELQEVTKVRTVFPETWLWTNLTTDGNGESSVVTTVPDTITSWVASAFAVNTQSGLGIAANTAKMTVFKPFFVTLNLPYSVIRGEHLAVQALVFNYMDVDMQVVVTLEGSEAFQHLLDEKNDIASASQNSQSGDKVVEILVEANSGKSVSFPIVPTGLGYVSLTVKAQSTLAADGLTRLLLVEPEGIPQTYASSSFVDLTDYGPDNIGSLTEKFKIELPSDHLVADSVKTKLSVTGDVIGPALNNLDSLLQMPTGCGEQNMIGFAPDVFIYKYLTTTGRTDSEITGKALNYMTTGYQRELTYRHTDGSFSAFGERDESGSTWLTAFVMRSFTQAAGFVYVDSKIIEKGLNWLALLQDSDGSFEEVGKVLHGKSLQGTTSGKISLTAYVLLSMLEENEAIVPSNELQALLSLTRADARSYLESKLERITDTQTLAIVTYALTLANSPKADQAFQMMDQKAILSGVMKHWEESGKSSVDHDSWYWQPASADVEISSYALLTYLARGDLSGSLAIVKWLTGQRNPYGGFGSTQDTVVGLHALSEFALATGLGAADGVAARMVKITVTSSSDPSISEVLEVTDTNSLVLQQLELTLDGGEVEVECEGYGTTLIQLSVMYNVMEKQNDASFDLNLIVSDINSNTIDVQACGKFLKSDSSGMAVMEFGIPSGFYAEETPLQQLITDNTIKKYEVDGKKINLYFDEITNEDTCFTMVILRSNMVTNSQASPVILYDYYKPENKIEMTYQSAKLNEASIWDICDDCNGAAITNPTSHATIIHSPSIAFNIIMLLLYITFIIYSY